MIPLLESPAAQRLAWALLHFLWQGSLLGLAAWVAFALLRRGSPQLRYLVGCAFLVACLGSVALTLGLRTPGASTSQPVDLASIPVLPALEGSPSANPGEMATPGSLPWQTRIQPFLPWLLVTWASGVVVLSLRAAGGWFWLRRLRDTAVPTAEPAWLDRLVRGSGMRRAVRFLESVRVTTPMCMGLLRPVVLLPFGFFAKLDPLAAEAVLAHELAHIRRLDSLVNGLQCVIEVLFFFHPAVWWISRRIRTEREHCCDDAAVLACGDAIFYAETLRRLDALRDRPPSLALSARGGNLMERMRRLLLVDPPQLRFATPSLLLLAALALMSTLPAQAEKIKALLPLAEEVSPFAPPETAHPQASEPITPLQSREPSTIPKAAALSSVGHPNLELPPLSSQVPPPVGQPSAPRDTAAEFGQEKAAEPVVKAQVAGGSATAPNPVTTSQPTSGLRPSPTTEPFAGTGPTPDEARQILMAFASTHPWGEAGPQTITRVEILGKARWNDGFTDHWPKEPGPEPLLQLAKRIDGWEVSFQVEAPKTPTLTLVVLLDKNGVIHWRKNRGRLPPGLDNLGGIYTPHH